MPELIPRGIAERIIAVSDDLERLGLTGIQSLEGLADLKVLAAEYLRLLEQDERLEWGVVWDVATGRTVEGDTVWVSVEEPCISVPPQERLEAVRATRDPLRTRNVRLRSRRPAGEWEEEKS